MYFDACLLKYLHLSLQWADTWSSIDGTILPTQQGVRDSFNLEKWPEQGLTSSPFFSLWYEPLFWKNAVTKWSNSIYINHVLLFAIWQVNKRAAESLADPKEYPNLFEDWEISLSLESNRTETRYPQFTFLFNVMVMNNGTLKHCLSLLRSRRYHHSYW